MMHDADIAVEEKNVQESQEWTTAGWLGSIGLLDQAGAALTPRDAVEALQQNQLLALLSLVPEVEGDEQQKLTMLEEKVRGQLRRGIDDFASKIAHCIIRLHAEYKAGATVTGGSVDNKFAAGKADFELSYASLSDFHNGLEGIIGPPALKFMEAMEEEHTRDHALNAEFTTGNYGITTKPQTEWLFVAGTPEQVTEHLKSIGGAWPAETQGLQDESHRRKRVPLEEFLKVGEELNEKLRKMGEPVLIEAEMAGARLYTGPMFVKYNGVLRTPPADGDVLYVTTLHGVNSCIIKLSKLTMATKVYRGVLGGSLPPSFLQPNEQGVKGGVEKAFMSTTTDRAVAMAYATSLPGKASVVFEIQQGMIDRGADVSHFSQYPFEKEILFAPYTGVEMIEEQVNGSVLLSKSRFSVNLKSLTLEQNFAKRLKLLKDMAADMQLEVRGALREQIQVWQNAHQPRVGMVVLVEPAIRDFKMKAQAQVLIGTHAEFNNDTRFQQAVKEMIQLKEKTRELKLHELLTIMADALQPEELVGSVEVFLVLIGGSEEVRGVSLAVLEKLQPSMPALSRQQATLAFTVLKEIRSKFKRLSFVKRERCMLSKLLAPRMEDLDITPSQLREAGFDLEFLSQVGCTVASLCSGAKEPDWTTLLAEGFPAAELRAVGWSGGGFVGALEGHSHHVNSACVTPNGEYAVTGSYDKTARIWRLADGEHVRTLEGHNGAVESVCMTPDGKHVVTGSGDNTARVWRLDDGKHVRTLEGHSGGVHSVCVTPDGKHVVTGSGDNTARVWRLDDGKHVRSLVWHLFPVLSVCVSPDGEHVITGSRDTMARVWRLHDGELVHTLKGHRITVESVCVTPDGKYVVTASWDKTARVWCLDDGKLVRTLEGHSDRVYSVCMTPDGKHVVTGSKDKTARVWRLDDGKHVGTLEGHSDLVKSVCVTPDGKRVVTGSWDNTARVQLLH